MEVLNVPGKLDCDTNDSKVGDPHNLISDVSTHERQLYKDSKIQNQLKILYDVRVREINNLREEYQNYKIEKDKEIGILKNKAILAEAEMRHIQSSLANSEGLLCKLAF